MNICVLTGSLSRQAGGLFSSVRGLSQHLAALSGVAVHVLGIEDDWTREDIAAWKPLPCRALPMIGVRRFGFAPSLGRALAGLDVDLLHVHGLWSYCSVASLAWHGRLGRPVVISPHGMLDPWALRHSSWKKRLAGALYELRHLRSAACIRALNESEAQAVRQAGLRNNICIIPNGVIMPDPAADVRAPWSADTEAGTRVLLYLGRIHPKKGLSQLIEAWARVQRNPPAAARDWQLVIAGWDEGGHVAELAAQVDSLDLQRAVRLLGPRHGAAADAAYRSASAFILPSFSEGLPNVVLEAWSHGLPVVMTPQCNLPGGFAAGAAVRIEPNSTSIERGLSQLFRMSDAERRTMGHAGRTLVEAAYTWPIIAEQVREVYDWLLGGGATPACVLRN